MNKPSLSVPLLQRSSPGVKAESRQNPSCLVDMEGIRNMRDMGGYPTRDGKRVAFGRIYRSASLYNATANDLDHLLGELSVRQVIDLRNGSETAVEREPERLLRDANYHWIPILVEGTSRDDIVKHLQQQHPEKEDFSALLVLVNQRLALDHQCDFKAWFAILLQEEPAFLFHCTEGKDRTGFAAALLFSALGVDRDIIFADYLLTNTVNAESIEERIKKSQVLSQFQVDIEQLRRLLMAHRDYLQAAFTAIEQHYGTVESYLERALGVDAVAIQALRAKFLE